MERSGLQTSEGKITALVTAVSAVLGALSAFNVLPITQETQELIIKTSGTVIAAVVSAYNIGRSIVKSKK